MDWARLETLGAGELVLATGLIPGTIEDGESTAEVIVLVLQNAQTKTRQELEYDRNPRHLNLRYIFLGRFQTHKRGRAYLLRDATVGF